MACTPLNIQNGLFLTSSAWLNAPSATFDGKTLSYAAGGANPGLSVQQGGNSVFHAQLANRTLKYMILGTPAKYLVILDAETGPGSSTRSVSLVNFATWSEVPILTVLASSNAVALPIVNASQGNGIVFLGYGQNGTDHTSVAIYRSDNGAVLCPLGSSFMPSGQTAGEATATQLIIHYSTGGMSQTKTCPKPVGECEITPTLQTFATVAVGGCPFTPQTKQFTIKNIGDDCLTVDSIANSPPFSVTTTSPALPAVLGHNETVLVTVQFNPAAAGNWPSVPLAVSTTPANGDNQLLCKGTAVAASFSIQFNATTLNFGTQPVGVPAPGKVLTITNNGSKPLNVSVPPLAVAGFSCAGFNGTLNCNQSQSLPVGFTPPAEGPHSASLVVTSDAPGSPHTVNLTGSGCVANATIVVPPTAPHDFGQVQRGFRTVWIFEVQNSGDGPLTFDGAISGPDAALFGLPDPIGSATVVQANRSYTALPVTPCGPGTAGSGKALVAVSFFANDAPKVASATLTLTSHNATNFPPAQTWAFPLTAEITPPIALDIGLVVDRSGSMNDPLGSRVKMDAAVSASQLFVELLRPDFDDRVSVVRFNHLADVVVPMTPVSSGTPPTQTEIGNKVGTDVPPADGNTAIAAGAVSGTREIQKPRATVPPALTKALVVLTDGKENTGFEDPSGSGDWFSILGGQMLRPLPAAGNVSTTPFPFPGDIDRYAIGIGVAGQVDPAQLDGVTGDPNHVFRVDQDLTGTQYFQLEKYYTQIYMDIVGTASVVDPMFWIGAGDMHEIEFDVLRGDVGALVVVYDFEGMRLPFWCVTPTGEVLDPASIPPGYQLRSGATRGARLVEFKMPLHEPDRYAGRWKVQIRHPGEVCFGMPPKQADKRGFLPSKCRALKEPVLYGIAIGVGSNFRMFPFITPAPVYVGDPIQLTALVSEAGLPVPGCTVTVDTTAPGGATSTQQLFDDGAHSDAGADDGEYATSFTHTVASGVYHFRFRAVGTSRDGEPVVREAVRDKTVLPRGRPTDGDGRDGDRFECCEELLKAMREQTALLKRLPQKK